MQDRPLYMETWRQLASDKSMVFLSGPRQSGKTTLARTIATQFANHLHFNWDLDKDKALLLKNPAFFQDINRKDDSPPLIAFDEIHKYRRWKNYLKGIYDTYAGSYRFLVLGSGRLDVYQKGGDSLAGRYFQFHLWPFTLAELGARRRSFESFYSDPLSVLSDDPGLADTWTQLTQLSGYPEPFLSGKKTFHEKWARTYRRQLIREDIRDATLLRRIGDMELLYDLLPERVASPFSLQSVGEILHVSPVSVAHWMKVFESFYLIFRISPWHQRMARAIRKEKKVYLFDPAHIPDPGACFENRVALELLRAVSTWNDRGWGDFDLRYVRNKEGQEVDFLITSRGKPFLLIETKLSDDTVSKSLVKFQTLLGVPGVQLVNRRGIYKSIQTGSLKTIVADAPRWLSGLP
ncbi:MAG: ATP-binding protein [Elusimicrobia bacterium]|nr:ATP-binding protein [Elusimicrobiota bacterium]